MLEPSTVLDRLGGVARGLQLQRLGVTRHALSDAARAGRIVRLRQGVYASLGTDPGCAAAASHGGAVTCAAALRRRGVWVLEADTRLHVWMGADGREHPHPDCRCVAHFFEGPTTFGITDVETALTHLFSCAGEEAFFASYESAWRLGLLSGVARMRIRDRLPARARWLTDIARADADSGLESLLRLRLHMLGVHLSCQVWIDGVGRVDFVIGGKVILEADGKENHAGVSHRHRDLSRDARTSRLGYETLRFDYTQIVHDWGLVQTAILAAIARADARR